MAHLWIEGKARGRLRDAESAQRDLYFANERVDDTVAFNNKRFNHCVFIDIGFKDAKFEDVDFSHSTFLRCYFRNAVFLNCNFTGCRFIDSNLKGSTVVTCNFNYSEWQGTSVPTDQMLANIPVHPNQAHQLLESLRLNAYSVGDGSSAREFFFESMAQSREHFYRVAFSKHSYYRHKYTGWQRASGCYNWLQLIFERWFWGYGEYPGLLFLWCVLLIGAFGVTYTLKTPQLFRFSEGGTLTQTLISALQFSALTFSGVTFTRITPEQADRLYWLLIAESFSGIVFTGLFAASIFRTITIRQGR